MDDTLRRLLRRERRRSRWIGRWEHLVGLTRCWRGQHRYKFGSGDFCIVCQHDRLGGRRP